MPQQAVQHDDVSSSSFATLMDTVQNDAGGPLLEMQGISKRFGATRALQDVDLKVPAAEVLALIGENGAGKSTLLKTLSGAHRADRGEMRIAGKPYMPRGPGDARRSGIAMIYQEVNLAPDLTVEDNVLLGRRGTGGGILWRSRQRSRVREALTTVGLGDLDPQAVAGDQSVATQQLLEVARALVSNARIILFDEPTSSLPQKDVERLFQIIRHLKSQHIGVVYISHFLEEVREVADRYTVLRDGRHVGSGELRGATDQEIVALMVGRDVEDLYPVVPHTPGKDRVGVRNLTGNPYPKDVDLSIRRGEILGIAGLVGAGRTELLRCIFGLDRVRSGAVTNDGRPVGRSPSQAIKAGFGLLSEDRKTEGLAQDLSIYENISMGGLHRYTRWGIYNPWRRNHAANELISRVEVKAQSGHQRVAELSGGNQQKVAVARILHQDAEIVLLDEPTKGIDVGTKAEIYRMMGVLAAEGRSVVFVSSYLPELLAVCDRVAVMGRGRIREIRDAAEWTEEAVMAAAIVTDAA